MISFLIVSFLIHFLQKFALKCSGFYKAGISITDALSMEYLMHDNPFDEDDSCDMLIKFGHISYLFFTQLS